MITTLFFEQENNLTKVIRLHSENNKYSLSIYMGLKEVVRQEDYLSFEYAKRVLEVHERELSQDFKYLIVDSYGESYRDCETFTTISEVREAIRSLNEMNCSEFTPLKSITASNLPIRIEAENGFIYEIVNT